MKRLLIISTGLFVLLFGTVSAQDVELRDPNRWIASALQWVPLRIVVEVPASTESYTTTLELVLDIDTLIEVDGKELIDATLVIEPLEAHSDSLRVLDIQPGDTREPLLETFVPTPSPVEITKSALARVHRDANLRAGPGMNYTVVHVAKAGEWIKIVATDKGKNWLLLEDGSWIAAWLVSGEGPLLPAMVEN